MPINYLTFQPTNFTFHVDRKHAAYKYNN